MMRDTNLKEYADPILYDLENPHFEPEGPFYLALAQDIGGSVLEIGCGTGRHTIPIASCGIDITGLDVVPEMLAEARRKAGALEIKWVEADARTFQLPKQFRFIFSTGAVFNHLLERADHEAFLARVRDHLEPEGIFAIDTINPVPAMLTSSDKEELWFDYTDQQGRQVQVSGNYDYDWVNQVKHETAIRRWQDEQGNEVMRRAPLALRYFFPQEMEALLHYNGFTVRHRYGHWDRTPIQPDSHQLIYICVKRP